MDTRTRNSIKTLLQILAVLGTAVIVSMIVHKGFVDLSALAEKHSGEEFWRALARYFLRNIGGGGSAEEDPAPPLIFRH